LLANGQDLDATIAALRATGMWELQVLAAVAGIIDRETASAMWKALPEWNPMATLGSYERACQAAMDGLRAIAETHAETAGWLLSEMLGAGVMGEPWKVGGQASVHLGRLDWVTELDRGISSSGSLTLEECKFLRSVRGNVMIGTNLSLNECERLESLPDGMDVGGYLLMDGCRSLVSLPRGLKVGASLFLMRCPAWDGKIPQDASIREHIYTDGHPDGIRLSEWHRLHPDGERG
jgi:hypothetical protein